MKGSFDKTQKKMNLKHKNIKNSDGIIKELVEFGNLIELNLSDNLLTYLPEEILKLSKLQSLDITNNPFENVILNFILIVRDCCNFIIELK